MLAEMQEAIRRDDPARLDLLEIRRAAERAHLVTRHLAAFSRPHPAQPVVLNVAHTLTASVRLIKRILGDDIQLVTTIDDEVVDREPALVRADPGHLGRMLLCLAVRARSALPQGGTLTIALVNQEDSVRLIVTTSEAPAAHPEHEQEHEREPESELSMVEELVRQCGGALRVEATQRGH